MDNSALIWRQSFHLVSQVLLGADLRPEKSHEREALLLAANFNVV
jgi:hypothetical protein